MLFGIRWGSLRAKIIAWSFVPTAIILAAVAWVTFIAYQRVTEDLVIERNRELTRFSTGEFAARLTQYTGLLTEYSGLLAGLPREAYADQDDLIVERDVLKRARSRFEVFDGGVLILDNQGTVVAAEPERLEILGQDWSSRATFRHMLRSPGPVFSDVVDDGPGGAEVIVVAVPITGDQGQFLGLIAGMFRLGATEANPFYTDITRLGIGQSGSAYLVDGQGRVIYHSDLAPIGKTFYDRVAVQQALDGEVGAIRTRDPDGRQIVASYAPVPGTSWGLVAQETWAALTSSGRGYRYFLLLLLALGVVVPGFVVSIGVRRITKPVTELIDAAQEVAKGNFGQTITARTGDEIEDLAEQFNLMAAQLRESYAHLEQRVAIRTRELAALNAIAATVSQSLDLHEILEDALDKTLEVMDVEGGGIYLLEEDPCLLHVAAHRGLGPQLVSEIDNLEVGEGFSGRVVQTGEPLVVKDIPADPRLTRGAVKEEGLLSLAIAPLRMKGRVLGTLFAVTRGYREFGDQDVQLLTSIGNQIGVALENARLFEAESEHRQEATLLAEMAKLVSGTLDLNEVLRLTAQYAIDVFKVGCCCIFLYDESSGTLRPATVIGIDGQAAPLLRDHAEPGPDARTGELTECEWTVSSITEVDFSPSEEMRRTVLEALQPLIVEDVPSYPHLSPQDPLELQSALVVPIEVGGRRLGAMQLGTHLPRKRLFTTDEGELALALANQAAMAIENARLFNAERRRAEQFRVIGEVGHRITSILEIDELLDQMARLIKEAFDYYYVGFGLVEGDELVSRAGAGPLWEAYASLRLKVGQEGIGGWVAQAGEPLLVLDVRQEPRYRFVPHAAETRSELCVPLKTKEAVIGVLDVQSDRPNAFDESDLAVLQSLANQAAVAIANARLYEQAQQLAVMEERSRLARELHDAVTQTLFSSSLIAEALPIIWESDQDEGRQLLGEIRRLSRGALAEMRTLLLELRPATLVEANLGDLLRQLGEAVAGRKDVSVAVTVEGECELPDDVHVALYRIAQEALNNVVKHARAKRVTVNLRCVTLGSSPSEGSGRVDLCIRDDGCGFDPSCVSPDRLGLDIMRERAQAVGAELEIESQLGAGARVAVRWGEDEGRTGGKT